MIPIILKKAKALPDGTIRDWKGKKVQKRGGKWVPYHEVDKRKVETPSQESKGMHTVISNIQQAVAAYDTVVNDPNYQGSGSGLQQRAVKSVLSEIASIGGAFKRFGFENEGQIDEWTENHGLSDPKSTLQLFQVDYADYDRSLFLAIPKKLVPKIQDALHNIFDYGIYDGIAEYTEKDQDYYESDSSHYRGW